MNKHRIASFLVKYKQTDYVKLSSTVGNLGSQFYKRRNYPQIKMVADWRFCSQVRSPQLWLPHTDTSLSTSRRLNEIKNQERYVPIRGSHNVNRLSITNKSERGKPTSPKASSDKWFSGQKAFGKRAYQTKTWSYSDHGSVISYSNWEVFTANSKTSSRSMRFFGFRFRDGAKSETLIIAPNRIHQLSPTITETTKLAPTFFVLGRYFERETTREITEDQQ